MFGIDKTSAIGLNDTADLNRTITQQELARVRPTCTSTWKLEGYSRAESLLPTKGKPGTTCTWLSEQQFDTVLPKHPRKCRKRKSQVEAGTDEQSKEPAESPKRKNQDKGDIELGFQELGKDKTVSPLKWGPLQQKTQDLAKGQEEDVIEVKFVGSGKGRKHTSSNTQNQHNVKFRTLWERHQHTDLVDFGSSLTHTRPAHTSKIKGCMEVHIHGCVTTQIQPNRATSPIKRHHLLVDNEKRYLPERHIETHKESGMNLKNERRGQHPQLDLLGRARAQISRDGVTGVILNNSILMPEGEEHSSESQKEGRGQEQSPELTADMEEEIRKALGPGPKEEVLSCEFKLNITRGNMQTLQESHWLNDEIVNFYMNLLMERSKSPGYPALHTFNTFFYSKLKCGGYRSVKRWTRTIDIFTKEIVLVPIHLEVHWSLVAIDLRKKTITYWDSMAQKRPDILGMIFQYLQEESKTRRNIDLNPLEWKQSSMTAEEIPLQLNRSDCGVFTCKYADYISRGQPITFSQHHMPLFRKKMVWEILHKHLL
ncbi:hypothetical protein STEG23_036273 [Scotinomys teguina]